MARSFKARDDLAGFFVCARQGAITWWFKSTRTRQGEA